MKQLVEIGHLANLNIGDRIFSRYDRDYYDVLEEDKVDGELVTIEDVNGKRNRVKLIDMEATYNEYLLEVETDEVIRYFISYVGYTNGVKSGFGHFSIRSDEDNYEKFWSTPTLDFVKSINKSLEADVINIVALNRIY